MTDAPKVLEKAPSAPPAAKEDSSARLIIVLAFVSLVAAAALAAGNELTKDRIKAARAQVRLQAISRVMPKCDNNPVDDAIQVKDPKGKATTVYRCRQKQPDGAAPVVAVAIERDSSANKQKPYSGLIQVLVGIDAKTGKIRTFKRKGADDVAVVILKHSETPGLGSKAEAYAFRKAYAGRDLKDGDKTSDGKIWTTAKDKPGLGFVDAISGATITSRAVTEVVQSALAVFNQNRQEILTKEKAPAPKAKAPAPAESGAPARPRPAPGGKE